MRNSATYFVFRISVVRLCHVSFSWAVGQNAVGAMVGSSFDAHAPLDGFKLRGEDKLAFVSDMFDLVAPTHDLLNHFISLGQTTMWRILALTRLGGQRGVLRPGAKILDVGCGTGWVTWFFGWYYRGMALDVEGMDCSKVMLDEARKINPDARFTVATCATCGTNRIPSTWSPRCTPCETSRTWTRASGRCTG